MISYVYYVNFCGIDFGAKSYEQAKDLVDTFYGYSIEKTIESGEEFDYAAHIGKVLMLECE